MTKAEFKRLRQKVGTQARVSGLMGVHVQTVIQWESGARPVPPARAAEIQRLADNPPPERSAADPMKSVSIESKGQAYVTTITSSSGDSRTITTPGLPFVRITGDSVEIVSGAEPKVTKK
jgi:DNA-binding transcriptional regulator YdaS (Cro superfamily)